MLARKDIHYS